VAPCGAHKSAPAAMPPAVAGGIAAGVLGVAALGFAAFYFWPAQQAATLALKSVATTAAAV